MEDVDSLRYCTRCGEYLGDYMQDDFYRLIRQMYCPSCRTTIRREQQAAWKRERRKQDREMKKAQKTQVQLLQEENELLRQLIQRQRAELEIERKGGDSDAKNQKFA